MARKMLVSLLFLVALVTLAVGCSGAKPASTEGKGSSASKREIKAKADGPLVDVKSLLTKAEVEAVLGEPVKDPELKETGNPLGQRIVTFTAVADSSLQMVTVSMVQTEGIDPQLKSNGRDAAKQFKIVKVAFDSIQPVTGVGDEAYWHKQTGFHVLKNNVDLTIDVNLKDKEAERQGEQDLAIKALSRENGDVV
ncbi:MAG: hypothetical protein M1548_03045 [Actinobacteria bacterium]|nr:hypothetical protein [Actinomycetota bacterium]